MREDFARTQRTKITIISKVFLKYLYFKIIRNLIFAAVLHILVEYSHKWQINGKIIELIDY